MPVHDLGYRPWRGQRMARWLRPWVVARSSISLVWRRRWLRTMLMLAWLPVVFPALGIFAFEYSSTDPGMQRAIFQIARGPLNQPELAQQIIENPEEARHQVWSSLILTFFRYPQLVAMVVLIGLIAPMLVSYDLRTKAYLMYFSRPLSPSQYILGKSAVIWFLLAMIATLPALLVYVLGVLLSPDLSVVMQTWDVPLRILGASAVLMIPTTALAIAYSSLTSESRYATFAWFATWAMGFVAYQVLTSTTAVVASAEQNRTRGRRRWENIEFDADRYRLLSPYHTLGKVESWVFGLDTSAASVVPAVLVLVAITVISFWMVRRRVIARLSV
ncbi:ABC-2 family transporter protein [Rubripirellula amarantea]|uniref:ABC-2 family transporter protein n=1 Tax=Rubripirellula amarantea TaxID=2527999 RepID=A0A5C5WIJ6_9BACT|nr:ABC transporter permease subunit [Rubripirellula amarantea]TWT50450.1 ABC-2 family transporter protein [Rubripirellula amarantea]